MKRLFVSFIFVFTAIMAMAQIEHIKVGVMLPLHDINGDGKRMVEYYRGLLMACDSLKAEGITTDVYAWNVEEGNQKKAKQLELTRLFHCARSEELRVTQEDWADLQSYISEQFPKLIPALYEKVPKLTEIELQISMLVKINVSITDIAYLVNRTKQAITVSRARLYKKITGEEGTADQFDNWIGSL